MSALAEVSEFPLRNNRTDDETDSVFLLSRRQTSIRTSGVVEEFDSAFDAAEALKTGRIDSVVGALPFSPETPSALTAPLSFTRVRGDLYHSNIPSLPTSRVAGFEPSRRSTPTGSAEPSNDFEQANSTKLSSHAP